MGSQKIQTARQEESWIQWCDDNLMAIPLIALFIAVPLVMVGVAVACTKTVLFVKSLLV